MNADAARNRAAILAIGDELLSGRTRDSNIHYLAGWLTQRGVTLAQARIVKDDIDMIASSLNELRGEYDYVFTSGGIGPTHDDMTVDAIAKAFGVDVIEDRKAIAMIRAWYEARGEEVTQARRRMARIPGGARLIENPASGAPGVRIGNVFVMAGVPRIFKAMLNAIDGEIERGPLLHSRAVTARDLPESVIADELRAIQSAIMHVTLGSYPIDGDQKGVTIIARANDPAIADNAISAVIAAVRAHGVEPEMGDRE